jgi:sulfite reductase (ferredoxin)
MTKKLIKIAEVAQLPVGERKLSTVEDRRIALFNLDGTIYAIDNHCTHRDGPVGAGELKEGVITCPWHGWRFNVTTGYCLEGGANLRCYPVYVEGNDVLVDVTPTDESNSDDDIYCYLVRYGTLGHIGRVGSINRIPCRRGDRVVVNTDRGVELAEVLEAHKDDTDRSNQERPAGELLRLATDEDKKREADLGDRHQRVLKASEELISQHGLSVTAVDAEQLFEGQTIIVYYLGEPTDKLGPIAVELSKTADNRRVQFQPIETLQTTEIKLSHEPSTQKPKRSKQELIKESSQFLRGTIMDELSCNTDKFSADDVSLLKFHGTYQQDDRDARKGRVPGVGKRHMFMVRLKIPGGRLTAGQLLGMLDLCDRFADGTLRVTTRQGLQLHGVAKGNLWQTIHEISQSMLTTLGACGDVVRNVMCCPAPQRNDRVHSRMQSTASDLAKHFAPRTSAYFEIWVDGEKRLDKSLESNAEPTYGRAYLPRKFKIGVALPHDNCIDVYTQDIGLLAVVEAGQLVGYNVLVGGGLGNSPSVKETFPRLGDPMAFVPYAEVLRVATAIVEVQRDFGDRENRRRARMKYLVDEWGVDRFKTKVEQYLDGEKLDDPRPVTVHGIDDHLGWHPQGDGKFYFGLYVENGRIKDEGGFRMKTGLRNLLERFRSPVRLTPQQSILLCDLPRESQEEIHELLGEHRISRLNEISNVRRHAIGCPALPTCGLAITESERVLPRVIEQLETELDRLGLNTDEFTVRMTGCPNACARPYTADIGLVGKAVGKYTVLVGGSMRGDRLNFIYKDMVPLENIVDELLPLLAHYKCERKPDESLGDFCDRKSIDALKQFGEAWTAPGNAAEGT